MKLRNIRKLIHTKNLAWLMIRVKPFIHNILGLAAINMSSAAVGVGSVVLSKEMVDNAVSGQPSKALGYIILFVIAQAVSLGLSSLSGFMSVSLNEKMSYQIEQDVLKKLFKSDWMMLSKYHSGDIITRLTNDVNNVTSLCVITLPGILVLSLQLALAFMVLLYYDILLALSAFALGPISIAISFLLGQRLKKLQHKIQTAESRHRSYVTELIQHMLIVKSFQYENESMARVKERQNDKYQCVVKKNKVSIAANSVLSAGYWLGYILAFIYGVFKLAGRKTTFGTFTAFIQLVGQIQDPFVGLAKSVPQMVASLSSAERLIELEELENEKEIIPLLPLIRANIGLTLERFTFGYSKEEIILKDITLNIHPKKITALIGSSGEGKTTLMRLLLSLLKPVSGNAYINMCTERILISDATRGFFTYVPQGNTLFSGTIAENLHVGKPEASLNEIESALKTACAWDFVQELPEKLETIVGEDGSGLSEGQAQRLCIARSLLRPAPVLLLDEATSALDMETEKNIFTNIRRLEPRRTCIVITHRLSVLPLCDIIYRLEKGKLYMHNKNDFSNMLDNEKTMIG